MATYERLQKILLTEYEIASERLSPAASLEDLGIDSLGLMELLFKIEDEFHIKVPSESVELIRVEDVVAYIDRLADAQNGDMPTATSTS